MFTLPIRGVNLGNWLVLETWMGSSPLSQAGVQDDHAYIGRFSDDDRAKALGRHYSSFVTEETFARLARAGAKLLRVPVPYHLFGSSHHVACVHYLDQAFDWAEQYGLGILIDLHTVPLSQNGFDNGGYTGMCAWSRSKRRMMETVGLLERIASRYAGRRAIWGIEPLNEPATKLVYLANMGRYWRHLGRVVRSWPISRRRLSWFYQCAYERIRPIVGPHVNMVFHDHFSLRGWEHFDPGRGDEHVWIDTHQYVAFADRGLKHYNLSEYCRLVERMGERVRRAAEYHPILVGEWSLANHARDLQGRSPEETRAWYQAFANAQLEAWDRGGASCFWSLRVGGPHRINWSFEECVKRGWLSMGT